MTQHTSRDNLKLTIVMGFRPRREEKELLCYFYSLFSLSIANYEEIFMNTI